jgi:hypothetical protein
MSVLNRKQLKKLLLKEFKMLGMAPMGGNMMGHAQHEDDMHVLPYEEEYPDNIISDDQLHAPRAQKGTVSREDCCAAVLSLIECCSCEETKAKLREACDELMNRSDDYGSCG